MPEQDAAQLQLSFLENNTALALQARAGHAWASAVPWDIFLNYVLPYANLDERRDDWRLQLHCQLRNMVAATHTAAAAAIEVNRRAWELWGVRFKANQTPKIMSPFQVLEAGYASCTGLSILLVDALRAVGVPARVTGTPEWNTAAGGNHDWVEVWTDGTWSFTGPAEWTLDGWNHTWFYPEPARHQIPGSSKHGIWTTSWQPTPGRTFFPMMWAPKSERRMVPGFDVTARYLALQDLGVQ